MFQIIYICILGPIIIGLFIDIYWEISEGDFLELFRPKYIIINVLFILCVLLYFLWLLPVINVLIQY